MSRDPRDVLSRPFPPPDFTVAYGTHGDHVADVRLPASARITTPAPLVLFLHGGFWRQAYDRGHVGPLAADLAARGFAVATPEYRRTGAGGGWPATFDDVAAAVRVVPALIAAHAPAEVDVERIVLAGHSAGGHLALWAAANLARDDRGVCAVVALAPIADLRAAYHLDLDGGAVAALLGGDPVTLPHVYSAANPIDLLPTRTPLLVVHGARDIHVPVEISRRFATAAALAGDEVTLVELPDTEHFGLIDPASSAWPSVVEALLVAVRS